MFASLKSKIKEETGNDISKITSSWRSGAFSNRTPPPDNAIPTTVVGGGGGDFMGDAVSPQLESYLRDRVSGPVVDVMKLERDHALQLEEKLRERDRIWEKRLEELKESFNTIQGEEARAAQSVARMAQAEAAQELMRRKEVEKRLQALQESATDALAAQDKLESLTEEFETARREWGRERAELKVALGRAESELKNISDDLILVKASLPQDHKNFAYEEEETITTTDNEELNSLRRQQAVLSRQLQEARLALADVKTSWSGQIASLETQVSRLSRQAGEEGAERRRALADKQDLKSELDFALEEINKMRESLANSEAKETDNELKKQLKDSLEEIEGLKKSLNEERETMASLRISLSESEKDNVEKQGDLDNMKSLLIDLQNECNALQRQCQKERRDKDDALLRNAQISQSVELSQCDIRHQESEMLDLKTKISQLEETIAQLRKEQANCLQIQKSENSRLNEIEVLSKQNEELLRSQESSKSTIEEYENQLADKNKNIKILQNRIVDMKKTLQREIQSGKTDVTSAEDADISRRYLKHVVMRFLTARELEARQLTRALATLLRLSAQEEALLHAALPPRGGISAWFGNLSPT